VIVFPEPCGENERSMIRSKAEPRNATLM